MNQILSYKLVFHPKDPELEGFAVELGTVESPTLSGAFRSLARCIEDFSKSYKGKGYELSSWSIH